MSARYLIGQALGFVVDVARERWREVTGIADRERAYTQAMVDLATVCDDARRYLRERDAARAEVERLGDALRVVMDERNDASRGQWRHAGISLTLLAEAEGTRARMKSAEAVANEAMREGLAAVEEWRGHFRMAEADIKEVAAKRLVAERDVRRLEGELAKARNANVAHAEWTRVARAVVEAARVVARMPITGTNGAVDGLYAALRALDESEAGR